MSTLMDRAAGKADRSRGSEPSAAPGAAAIAMGAGVRAAVQAAAASLVVVLFPTVFGWAAGSSDHASWGIAVRVAADVWLLAHHTGIAIDGGHVGLTPLGLLLIPLTACWFAGVRLARGLDPHATAIRNGVGRARPVFPPTSALVAFVASYAAIATVVSAMVVTESARPLGAQALFGSSAVATLGALTGAAAWQAGGRIAGLLLLGQKALPAVVRGRVTPWFGPAGVALGVQLAAGLALVLVSIALGWERVLELHRALDPGVAGGIILVLAQLVLLPNVMIWAVAVLAGPGFGVGAGTSITAGGSVLGPVPAVPFLGALPVPGQHDAMWWCLLGVPVMAGVAAGIRIERMDRLGRCRQWLLDAAGAGLICGLALGLLAWLSGGPAGPGRLADMGPSAWRLALAGGAEVTVGAVVTVLSLAVAHWCRRRFAADAQGERPD